MSSEMFSFVSTYLTSDLFDTSFFDQNLDTLSVWHVTEEKLSLYHVCYTKNEEFFGAVRCLGAFWSLFGVFDEAEKVAVRPHGQSLAARQLTICRELVLPKPKKVTALSSKYLESSISRKRNYSSPSLSANKR